jgi:hypothetical protein
MSRYQVLAVFIAAMGASVPAAAQPQPGAEHGQFFLYVSPGSAIHIGGGGEAALHGGFGVATEVGAFVPAAGQRRVTTLSVDAAYHLRGQHPAHIDPYLAGGLSVHLLQDRKTIGPTAGAGVVYWLAAHGGYHLGVGAECRRNFGSGLGELRVSVRLWQ